MFGFCKCGGLLMPANGRVRCRKCGAEQSSQAVETIVKNERQSKQIAVIEENEPMLPTIEQECSKCGNATCFFWVIQTRASDEPPTRFFRCTKCSHTWREYS